MPTFSELFCERYGVHPDNFADAVFWRCLHRRALVLAPFLRLLMPAYFTADYDLIRDIGRLTRASGLNDDLADFYSHPRNVGFARRRLKVRISVRLVTKLVTRVFAAPPAPSNSMMSGTDTGAPFRNDRRVARGEATPPAAAHLPPRAV
jgi:hypothetical protein